MKIKSVRIQNLRSLRDQIIEMSEYTCLVGANGAGKSTILCALNIFFRDREQCNKSEPSRRRGLLSEGYLSAYRDHGNLRRPQ
ncbi:AAA family ATPase [Methylobacterium sp. CM6241]